MPALLNSLFTMLRSLRPPRRWHLGVLLLGGIFAGLAALTFHVSKASSYLVDDPATCVNCHIMAPQYATWAKSSHARSATCNDCHVPQDNLLLQYGFKAYDGSRHAFMFTFRLEPQVIQIHAPGAFVVERNCVRCHQDLLDRTMAMAGTAHGAGGSCVDCHREVPHGRVNSLASVPHARVPAPDPVRMPAWLQKALGEPPRRPPLAFDLSPSPSSP